MDTELCAVAPADWQIKSVEDVCVRVTSGGTPSRREPAYYAVGTWPWVKTQELQDKWIDDTEEHITEAAVASSSAKVLPEHTVLIAMYGATVGQLGILRRPMTCNQACSALIVNPSEANYRFIYYQLLQARPQIKGLATGAAQQNLSGALIKSLRLPFPPLPEQRAIAHILGTLDDKIELNRRTSETLEAMARALFNSWFVDFDPVRAKAEGRDPGLPKHIADLFPSRFVDSELGEIPDGWEVGTLGDVADHPRRSVRPEQIKTDTPYIALEHMPKRCIALSEWGTGDGLESNKFRFNRGEILFGKLRPYFHKVGVAPVDGVCSTDIVVVTPRAPKWFGFVLGQTSSSEFVDFTNAGSTGTKMPRTSWKEMARFEAVLPQESVAVAFNQIMQPTIERIIKATHESRALATVRDVLLPRLIAGEIRPKTSETVIGVSSNVG